MPEQTSKSKATVVDRFNRIARLPYSRNIPELELFPDDGSRTDALESLERDMAPRSILGWLWFVVFCLGLFVLPFYGAGFLIDVLWPGLAHGSTIALIAGLVIYTIIVFVLIRRDVPRGLRKRLLKVGVPVCMKCGYGLKGLPPDRRVCPECGKSLSAEARSLLSGSSSRGASR